MIRISSLATISPADLRRLIVGYTSDSRYAVRRTESEGELILRLELLPLPQPYRKQYDHLDDETIARYNEVAGLGFSLGAYDAGELVGVALAEPQQWNRSLTVLEFHVDSRYQGEGIGRKLIESLAQQAGEAGFRTIVCETQNTNVPAVRFYRSVGFSVEGIDLSYYSNSDFPDGEIALFMKKRTDIP